MSNTPAYKHPLYVTWRMMRRRCQTPNSDGYESYGGRGITVCDRWSNDFWTFVEDVSPKPGPEYTLDRRNNDGNYCPENCRWATREEQAANRRDTVRVTLNGEERCLTAWALIFGVRQQTVEKRMREQGMGALGALYLPVGRCGARKRKLDPIVAEIAAFYAA